MSKKILMICKSMAAVSIAALLFFFGLLGTAAPVISHAATSEVVLQDLRKDKRFDENDYPYVKDDYGLYVIQIGESSNKELFVYVYQPCHDTYDLKGTKISISYGYSVNGANLEPHLYNLKLVSTSGTLDKYYVEDFTVPNDGDRYYNIVSIYREGYPYIDGEPGDEFWETGIAYSVGQQWYACDVNDGKKYEMNTFKTMTVETIFQGSITFDNGFYLGKLFDYDQTMDCWFYCFNAEDYQIEHVFQATLGYSIEDIEENYNLSGGFRASNQRENLTTTLYETDYVTYQGRGINGRKFKWNRFLKSVEFIKTAEDQKVKFDSTVRETVLSSQWVFCFMETERERRVPVGSLSPWYYYSHVYDVGLLQIDFQDISGKRYDLGVVNDLTTADSVADGIGTAKSWSEVFEEFWEKFLKAIFLILAVIALLVVINLVKPIRDFLKFILNAIRFVITAPFKVLKKLFKKDG